MARQTKRDQLVETAAKLFYREGFNATGIDRVLKKAGVAKMTLYNNFPSKTDLMVAALESTAAWFRADMRAAMDHAGSDPRARLLAVFDFYDRLFKKQQFHGCFFVNAATEFGQPGHPVHDAAARQKGDLRKLCIRLVGDAGAADPEALGAQIYLLIEGAITTAHVLGDRDAARAAGTAAVALLDAALPTRSD